MFDFETFETFVRDLTENWKNGNRSDVITALGKLHPLHAALAGAYLIAMIGDGSETQFARMITDVAPDFALPE